MPLRFGLTSLEKSLILLFVAMTAACIGLVVVYATGANSSTGGNGGGEIFQISYRDNYSEKCIVIPRADDI